MTRSPFIFTNQAPGSRMRPRKRLSSVISRGKEQKPALAFNRLWGKRHSLFPSGLGRANLSRRPSGKQLRTSRPLKNYGAPPASTSRSEKRPIRNIQNGGRASALTPRVPPQQSHRARLPARRLRMVLLKTHAPCPGSSKFGRAFDVPNRFRWPLVQFFSRVKNKPKSFVERKGGRSANFVSNPMACRTAFCTGLGNLASYKD